MTGHYGCLDFPCLDFKYVVLNGYQNQVDVLRNIIEKNMHRNTCVTCLLFAVNDSQLSSVKY